MERQFKLSFIFLLLTTVGVFHTKAEITKGNRSNEYTIHKTRTDGNQEAPILLKHAEMIEAYADSILSKENPYNRADVYGKQADEYDAAPISPILNGFMNDSAYADGQTFLLEGGKTYYLDGNDGIHKGFVLRTDPKDVAEGKRARIICGIGKSTQLFDMGINGEQWNGGPYTMFMLGCSLEVGEENAELCMKKLAFYDIDFDNPKAFNYGDQVAQMGNATGNYFMNMYNNGMGMTLDSLVIENCSFKRIVRGFIREQGPNHKIWNHVLIKNNLFMDCGYYNQGAGGYPWIAGSGRYENSNLYADFKVVGNTFYDSPFPSIFSEERGIEWESGIIWNITFSNNTLINLNTRGNGSIFKMRNLPDGSVFNVENNLIALCKQPEDIRVLECYGADIREAWKADGSTGHVTLNFNNNWSTNNDLTNGQIFSANPWTSNSNNFGKLVKNNQATLNGSLEMNVANISATDLMVQPCPPHVALTHSDQHMHRADALDGTASTAYNVNLHFQNTDAVRNSEIYKLGIGASRWRTSVTEPESIEYIQTTVSFKGSATVYNVAGCMVRKVVIENGHSLKSCLVGLPSGLYLIRINDEVIKMMK